MQTKLHRIGNISLIIVFLNALIPGIMVQHIETQKTDLRKTIFNLQHLAQQVDSVESNFIDAYKTAVLTLRQAAGIKTLILDSQGKNGVDTKALFIIILSLPYIMSTAWYRLVNLLPQLITILEKQINYISVIHSPSLPPPKVS